MQCRGLVGCNLAKVQSPKSRQQKFVQDMAPAGRRRETLTSDIETMLRAAFENRILPFDSAAARAYAEIAAARRAAGRPVSQSDGQIAAIAHSRGMAVATRNIRDFEATGVALIDPWVSA